MTKYKALVEVVSIGTEAGKDGKTVVVRKINVVGNAEGKRRLSARKLQEALEELRVGESGDLPIRSNSEMLVRRRKV